MTSPVTPDSDDRSHADDSEGTDTGARRSGDAGHRDRKVGLIIFGAVLILLGGVSVLMGLIAPVAMVVAPGGETANAVDGAEAAALPAQDWRAAISSLLTHVLIGGLLVVLGVGSMLRRRWVPAVTLSVAWIWLIAGTMALAMCLYMGPELRAAMEAMVIEASAQDPHVQAVARTTIAIVLGVMLVLMAVLGVVLPGLMVLFYRSRSVRATCEAHHPDTLAWTDRCSTRLVGLSVSLALLAGVLFAMLPYAAAPAFGLVLKGPMAAAAVLLVVAACLWLAVLVAQRRGAGWWGTVVLLLVVTIGPVINALIYTPAEQLKHIGMTDPAYEQLMTEDLMAKSQIAMIVGFVLIGVITIVYMLKIRPDFERRR